MPNINWPEVVLRLIGDGVIISVIVIFVQYIIHNQTIELEKQKRKDYFVWYNYSKLSEFGEKLAQLLIQSFGIMQSSNFKKAEYPDLEYQKFDITFKGEKEKISFHDLFIEYQLYAPIDVTDKCYESFETYRHNDFVQTEKLLMQTLDLLNRNLMISRSSDEIERIFDKTAKSSREQI